MLLGKTTESSTGSPHPSSDQAQKKSRVPIRKIGQKVCTRQSRIFNIPSRTQAKVARLQISLVKFQRSYDQRQKKLNHRLKKEQKAGKKWNKLKQQLMERQLLGNGYKTTDSVLSRAREKYDVALEKVVKVEKKLLERKKDIKETKSELQWLCFQKIRV